MLDNHLYTDYVGVMRFNRAECLRNAYAKNSCTKCQDVCAHNAFSLVQNKLRLMPSCVQCGACVGECPSGALSLYGFSFDVVTRSLEKDALLCCTKQGMSCLGALRMDEWCALLVRGYSPKCHLAQCNTCEHNQDNRVKRLIEQKIAIANDFAKALGIHEHITLCEQTPKEEALSRRAFFERLVSTMPKEAPSSYVPYQALKESLKWRHKEPESIQKAQGLFFHKKTISKACDNCKECVQFCPTNALHYEDSKSRILFTMSRCIGCGICEAICKKEAIHEVDEGSIDLKVFMNDAQILLIEHHLAVCNVCKCAFVTTSDETTCTRCSGYEKEHPEMFFLASKSH